MGLENYEILQHEKMLNIQPFGWKGNLLTANFGDGFGAGALSGKSSGLHRWGMSAGVLPDMDCYSIDYSVDESDFTATRFVYFLEFFKRHITLGNKPFLIEFRNKFWLVSFDSDQIDFEQMTATLFTGGTVSLRQRRVADLQFQADGSVFDISLLSQISHHWKANAIAGAVDNATLPDDVWTDLIPTGEDLQSANCIYKANQQNGLPIVRLDQSGLADSLATNTSTVFYEAFLVMKMREATFSDYVGIISNNDAVTAQPALNGNSGTAIFYNFGFGDGYSFKLNGTSYPESGQLAPMNAFGVVHIRYETGWVMPQGLLFGRDRPSSFPTRNAEADFGEIIICKEPISKIEADAMNINLMNTWGIT